MNLYVAVTDNDWFTLHGHGRVAGYNRNARRVMDENNQDDAPKQIPIGDLKIDPTAEDLSDSPAMQPYMKLALAVMGHKDPRPAVGAIAALPLEQRYTYRVASALKWAFADFENLNVVADRRTLGQEDLDKLVEMLRIRPLQFCVPGGIVRRRPDGNDHVRIYRAGEDAAGQAPREVGTGNVSTSIVKVRTCG